jgi:two-component system cell cycle sensor histidine kinase PleC
MRFTSIRATIAYAAAAGVLLVAGLGLFAADRVREAGDLVVETFDRPLMAISHARAAQAGIAALRAPAEAGQAGARERDALAEDVLLDLGIAAERALSDEAAAAARDAAAALLAWRGSPDDGALRTAADAVELLIDHTAGDAFLRRQQAIAIVEQGRTATLAAIGVAAALSLGLALVLARRILGRVDAAARVASAIAGGDLAVEVPRSGRDELGRLLAAMATMREAIAAMMAREVAQRRSAEARLADALKGASQGVVLADADLRIVIANDAVKRLAPGAAEAAREGAPLAGLLDAALPAATTAFLDRSGAPANARAAVQADLADGRRLAIDRSQTAEGGTALFLTDITALKEREAALEAARDRAEAADRAKSRFIANMSHELRTPLNAVIGFAELIETVVADRPGEDEVVEYARDIRTGGEHLLRIINDILDLVRGEAGKLSVEPRAVDVGDLLDWCERIIGPSCVEKGVALEVDMPNGLLLARADPTKLRQVALNLLSNAVKFTPAGGRVLIAAERDADERVVIRVTDTGIGMRPEEVPVALTPFGQLESGLSRRYEGTGLGLPLAKALVELHGGELWIDTEPGRGTSVVVALPASTD